MVIQLTNPEGRQVKELQDCSLDMELNDGERDFEVTVSAGDYDNSMDYGCRIFASDTEYGGILGKLISSTSDNAITWQGYTWRGMLANKVIVPPDGENYYTVSGELNTILRDLIEPRFSGVFIVPDADTGVTVENWQFERFCTLLDGIAKLLKSVGYRIDIRYNEGDPNGVGWVEVQAVPIVDYTSELELSQDSRLNFRATDKRNGVNHLIIGGKGEMQERNIIHLYVQEDGSIGKTQCYTGIDEVEYFYENTSTDSADVGKAGIEKLKELMDYKSFDMDIESLGIDIAIGDIVGGRDHITGMCMSAPVENIIIKIEDGEISKEYRLEGT